MFSDIIIVGGGMTGSALACALGTSKLFSKISLIDGPASVPYKQSTVPDPRVVTLTPASQFFMDSIGTWDKIPKPRKCFFSGMTVWDYFGTGSMTFGNASGWVLENKEIINANLQRLSELDVEIISSKVKKIDRKIGEIVIELEDGRVLETSLVIGADGKNSKVRNDMNIGSFKKDYQHHGLAAIVKVETPSPIAYQRFLQTGPLALLPLWEDYVSIVWSAPPDIISDLMEISEPEFINSLNSAISSPSFIQFPVSGQVLPPRIIETCSKKFSYPYTLMQAYSFVEPRVALVGDAAHTIHPMAGQGYNLGVYDVANLANILCQGAKVGKDPGDLSLLQSYSNKARAYNSAFAFFEEGILAWSYDIQSLHYLRNLKFSLVNNVPPLKDLFVRGANGFDFIPSQFEWSIA